MKEQSEEAPVDPALDLPLEVGSAAKHDELGRHGFAHSVAEVLRKVGPKAGLTVSIEGAWGSGKTSTLALIEEILINEPESKRPLIVHFNPWLIGDRDALLKAFLTRMATEISAEDKAEQASDVAKQLKAYSTVFDVLKLVPGAEPWASIVKSVVSKTGEATGAIAKQRAADVEGRKQKLEKALRALDRPVLVFLDDMDRLFPTEVYEMVRIIKAVADLPNVGYVIAWDAKYVAEALKEASIPQAEGFLDKIVQFRMPLPRLSSEARDRLVTTAFERIPEAAMKSYFPSDEDRVSIVYFSGLKDMFEQPRDVVRIFNALSTIEPSLRGEVSLGDIFGLSGLIVKAPLVYDLLCRHPEFFIGRRLDGHIPFSKPEEAVKAGSNQLEEVIDRCSNPRATSALINGLFPAVRAAKQNGFMFSGTADGHISEASRLAIALAQSVGSETVSLVKVRRYLLEASERNALVEDMASKQCLDFLEEVGKFSSLLNQGSTADVTTLCLDVARHVDFPTYVIRRATRELFSPSIQFVAVRTIVQIVEAAKLKNGAEVSENIIRNSEALTVSMYLMVDSFAPDEKNTYEELKVPDEKRGTLTEVVAGNVLASAREGILLSKCDPAFIFWNLARFAPHVCPEIFAALKQHHPDLDGFALEILRYRFSSNGGRSYAIPSDREVLEAYCSVEKLKVHAKERVKDTSITKEARAAWRSVLEERPVFGKDGTVDAD